MKTVAIVGAAALSLLSPPALAQQGGIELGMLECRIEGGTGLVLGSRKDLNCRFNPAEGSFAPEDYAGSVTKFGLDVGVTGDTFMQWLVLGPSFDIYAPGSLAGSYVGASAEASAAVGGGANILVGGLKNTITLQPVSLQAQTGVNLALGVTQFELRVPNPAG
jgi:Protein of unknown function (DUF992)